MNHYCRKQGAYVLAVFFAMSVAVSGCRFKLPSAPEQQHLVRMGAFPGDVPNWVKQPEDREPRLTSRTGVLATTYSLPEAVQSTARSLPTVDVSTATQTEEERRGQLRPARDKGMEDKSDSAPSSVFQEESESGKVVPDVKDENSPFNRIAETCPGVESSVSDAVRSTNPADRISKYKQLTLRCPTSPDLWIWLGKEYQTQNKLLDARRCFEQAISLDGANMEARGSLDEVKKNMSK